MTLEGGYDSSVAKPHRDDAALKAAACTKHFEAPGLEQRRLLWETLRTPHSGLTRKKGGTISGGMHRQGGSSGKTLLWPDMVEDSGQ